MIVAITGGTGFIGQKLAQHCLACGDQVRVLSRRASANAGMKLYPGDLSTPGNLDAFVDGADMLYHCAGEIRNEARMRAVHVEGTQRLIEAANGRIGRWVQLSSVGAYGKQRHGLVSEQTEPNPCGEYETTKVESDKLVSKAARQGAFEHAILRPSNVYGSGMSNQSLYGMVEMIRRGWFFYIGKPGASANYIHVDNVVEALHLCGTKPDADGQIYNLSDHRSLESFVGNIAATLGKPAPTMRLPEVPIRLAAKILGQLPAFPLTEARVDALTVRAIYSTDKIKSELGYRHVISMEAGLQQLVLSRHQPPQ